MSLTLMKKIKRSDADLCVNCGKKPCLCKIPKFKTRRLNDGAGLPVGMTRRGGQRRIS